jgi:hypothetical protein
MFDFKNLIAEKQYKRVFATLPLFCAAVEKVAKIQMSEVKTIHEFSIVEMQFYTERTYM